MNTDKKTDQQIKGSVRVTIEQSFIFEQSFIHSFIHSFIQ